MSTTIEYTETTVINNAAEWVALDVRSVLAGGTDPLQLIQKTIRELSPTRGLALTAPFVPTPLVQLLSKQGFAAHSHRYAPDEVTTWLWRPVEAVDAAVTSKHNGETNRESIQERFGTNMQTIDVRGLPMPQPMLQILAAVEKLPADTALKVLHQRIPVYLLPELAARNIGYAISETTDNGIELLLYKM